MMAADVVLAGEVFSASDPLKERIWKTTRYADVGIPRFDMSISWDDLA